MTKLILVTVGPMAAEAIRAACFGVRRNNAPKAVTPDNADDFNEYRNPMASQQALAASKRLSIPASGRPLSVEIELDGTEVTRVEEYTTPGQRIYEKILGVDDLGTSKSEMDKVKALNGHYDEFFQQMSLLRMNFNMAKSKLEMHDESKVKSPQVLKFIKARGMPKELDLAERKQLQITAQGVVDYCEDLMRDYLPVSKMPKKFMKQVEEIQRRKACGTRIKWEYFPVNATTEDVRPELIADVQALQALAAEFLEGGEFYCEDAAAYDLTRVPSAHKVWKMKNPFKKAKK